MPSETDLRRASDEFLARLDELDALERLKRVAEPGSDEFLGLAERIRELAQELYDVSQRQEQLADDTARQRAAGDVDTPTTPIAQQEPRDPTTILAEWRELERQLASATDGTDTSVHQQAIDRLRVEYRLAFERRTARKTD